MSQNPFGELGDALGGAGGLDLNALMEQAQQMQAGLEAAQTELEQATVDGTVAGVTVTVSGVGDLTAVAIRPGQFDGNDQESLDDLGDLVIAAYRDARRKADALMAEKMGPLAGGGLPGLPGSGGAGPLGFQ